MPLYEFRCPEGHDFEKFYRSIGSSKSEEKCPECGGDAARLMSTAGLVFKGSGFYITDYGKDGKKAERDAATAQSTAKAEKAEKAAKAESGTSDSKPGDAVTKSADSSAAPAATPAPKPADAAKPAATPAAKPAPAKNTK